MSLQFDDTIFDPSDDQLCNILDRHPILGRRIPGDLIFDAYTSEGERQRDLQTFHSVTLKFSWTLGKSD